MKYHDNGDKNESYTCDICGKISPSRQCAKIHRKIHDESRPTYPCADCGKIYLSSSALGQHRKWHTGKAFKCVQCPKMFILKAEYKIHLRFHTHDYPYQCEMCDKKFNAIGHLNSHRKMHLGWKIKCKVCDKLFATRAAYSDHAFKHSEMPYKCLHCPKGYPTKTKLKYHLKTTHSMDMTMDEINKVYIKQPSVKRREKVEWIKVDSNEKKSTKSFTRWAALKQHLQIHEGKPTNTESHPCDVCGKISPSQQLAKIHRKIHDEARPTYPCDECEKVYLSAASLRLHRRWHTGETFQCIQCPKMFVTKPEYKIHLRFHTRDFPFQCEMCGKKFNAKGHLNSHLKMHLDLKIKCKVCGKLFATRPAYRDHVFKHSEMPFKCLHCTKGYPTKSKLRFHLRATHSLDMPMEEIRKIYVRQPTSVAKRERVEWIKVDDPNKKSTASDTNLQNEL
ncbi:zinc finger protein 888-like [Episyrphus balteatus]|uniref:zinc finger protein 888-like n=1 Tax=Episyrphus balteatus TaxID=286459 RepID=UPI002485A013|nr:zinc finger protein 888-like [Episyrphus balteatus]